MTIPFQRYIVLLSRGIGVLLLFSVFLSCTPLHLPAVTPTAKASLTLTALPSPLPSLTPSPTSAIQLKDEQLRGVTIRFWHPYSGEVGETFERLAVEFSRQNQWNLSVVSERVNGIDLLDERMNTALTEGNVPHLVIAPLYQALQWNQSRPILVDWSIYTEDVIWGISSSDRQWYYPNMWEASFLEGHRWGIPARRVAQLLLYNASWANELGFNAAPDSSTELQQQACAVRSEGDQTNPNGSRGYLFTHDYPTILAWFMAFGAQITGNEQESYQFKSAEVEKALVFLRKLFEQECTLNDPDLDPINAFVQRRALIVPGNSAQLQLVEQAMENAANRDRWTVLPFPTVNGEASTVLYGTDFVLLRSSEREELAAWLFVRWLLEKETQQRLAEETFGLPLRRDVGEALQKETGLPSGYRAAIEYLPLGVNEPLWASWDRVRWAVGDSSRQLVAWYFTLDQMPSLVQLLEKTAADLHSRQP
ncbi:MAG: N-Acetyl-D-glucosamine ABC transport system, sugar-binding protein [Anaerolineae bacterium]|nr:MAG: N-Acetyl-D-glucosamine ABC transport system, sugar-binding protein [Anaerolineae bacterium]